MSEKRKNNATMSSKGLEKHVTDQQVGSMIARQGQTSLLIVEVTHGAYTNELDGSHRLALTPGDVVLVPAEQETRTREFMRALYLAQPDEEGQPRMEGTEPGEPTVEQTSSQIDTAIAKDDTGEVIGIDDREPALT